VTRGEPRPTGPTRSLVVTRSYLHLEPRLGSAGRPRHPQYPRHMPAPSSAAIRSGHVCAIKIKDQAHETVQTPLLPLPLPLPLSSGDILTPGSGQSTQVRRARGLRAAHRGLLYCSSGVEPRIRGVREKRLFLISLKDEERGQFT
jgi:hypothetical protein